MPLLDPALTREGYRATLAAFYAFYAPLEERIARLPGWRAVDFDLAVRRKAPLIARDLAALGAPARELEQVAPGDELPRVDTLPRALGALYVLEGATLGGQIIRRHLAATLGLGPATGAAFLTSYGDQVGPMWKAFRRFVTEYEGREGCGEVIVEAACDTFDALTRWITRSEGACVR